MSIDNSENSEIGPNRRGKDEKKDAGNGKNKDKNSKKGRKRKTDRIREKRKRAQDSGWTNEMDGLLRKMFNSCAICGKSKRLSKDHLVPLCNGGKLEPGNVVRLCRSCNIRKANKMPNELPDEIRSKLEELALKFKQIYDDLKLGKKISARGDTNGENKPGNENSENRAKGRGREE